jgi:hypothetical protein
MEGLVPSVNLETASLENSDRLRISATNPAVGFGGPLAAATGTSVPLADSIMPYAYPKYSNHPDAAAHVKQFRSIWAVNHGTQGLTPTEQEQSMIAWSFSCPWKGRLHTGTPSKISAR